MPTDRSAWIRLKSADLSAEIDPLGAQLSILADAAGRDLLWNGEPSIWSGRAPLLFPIVGTLAGGIYRLGAKQYALPRHGFGRVSLFTLVSADATSAVLRLSATESTGKVYPFEFELDLHFELAGPTLAITARVRNRGPIDMPASCGYHPGFRWPLPYGIPREQHFIEFASDEPAPVRRIDAQGLLAPEPQKTPIVARRLALCDDLFAEDVLILDAVRSRFLTYGAAHGPKLRVSFPDSPYLGLWTKPGAPFLCIEPWQGIADPSGYTGDFTAKPGVFLVPPGAEHAVRMALSLLPQ
jgi:galactose mutarotase-like enzyme